MTRCLVRLQSSAALASPCQHAEPAPQAVAVDSEAIACVAANAVNWLDTEGAIDWFLRVLQARMAADGYHLEYSSP